VREEMCKTSVTKYGAFGKNKSQGIKSKINVFVDVSFFIKLEIKYGIHARKRFQARYIRLALLNMLPRTSTKAVASTEANKRAWFILDFAMY
jgi:hypothetical protein